MSSVTLEVKDNIGYITLNRPPANAFDFDMYKALKESFDEVNTNDNIRVVIISAVGKFFSAGNDVGDFASPENFSDEYGTMVEDGLSSIVKSKKPVISAVQGIAVGSGFCVASYSDIVLATPKAKFGITEVQVGIIGGAPEASYSLPPKIVRYMALTGNLLTADQAKSYNMVYEVVPSDLLMATAEKIAKKIMGNPPITVLYMKQSLDNIYEPDKVAKKIEFDGEKTTESMKTEDFKEAVNAFMEKRAPIYKSK